MEIIEEIEHDIKWRTKSKEISFWFDNWTKQEALYFIDENKEQIEEIEVKRFIKNEVRKAEKVREVLSEEVSEYIMEEINWKIKEDDIDKPFWMENNNGEFTITSVFQSLRSKKDFKKILVEVHMEREVPLRLIF